MTQHVWGPRRLAYTTIARGVGGYHEARSHQDGLVASLDGTCGSEFPTDGGSYRLAFAFTGYFLERYRQSGPIAAWALWASAARYGHRYAKGANADNYEVVGRRVVSAALAWEWRDKHVHQRLRDEPLLGALLGSFEEAGAWQPLRDYLEEMRYDGMINLFETGHPERVPSPGPLRSDISVWADGNPPS